MGSTAASSWETLSGICHSICRQRCDVGRDGVRLVHLSPAEADPTAQHQGGLLGEKACFKVVLFFF